MIKKICFEIQNTCTAARISLILTSCTASVLLLSAFFFCFNDNLGLWAIYKGEMLASVSVKVFSVGIFCSLIGDFLMSAVDNTGK